MDAPDIECEDGSRKSTIMHVKDTMFGVPSVSHKNNMVKSESVLDRVKNINAQYVLKKESLP